MLLVADAFKFVASTALFLRTLFKIIVSYYTEESNKAQKLTAAELKGTGLDKPLPQTLPSITDIKKIIPSHCFQPRVATSMYYVVKDFVLIAAAYFAIVYLQQLFPSTALQVAFMVLYWAIQGTFFTAVFVVGHDCGHGSFSNHPLLNDIVGTVMHGFLLAPYYMWKLTHQTHHKNNANLEKDEVFYPVRASQTNPNDKVLPGFGFGTGWFGYLWLGYKPRAVCHYNVFHKAFERHVLGCVLSLAGMGAMSTLLYFFWQIHGTVGLICYYFVPLFIFASYCVIITFLQHNEMNIPWYSDEKWDFVRGQLSTVDRHYGIVHYIIHSIGTHQMHHMFTKIPHYHLEEATVHFRKAYPQLVKICDEPIMHSFLRMFRKYETQGVIADDTVIHEYK